jgi:rSAM/selenodomain-associated transferase 1
MPAELLIAFVKRPRAGEVKTRLARDLGPGDAAELYRAMADHVLRETAPVPAGYARLVRFAPREARDEIAAWLPGEPLEPQTAGDLGARMAGAFAQAFADGAQRVVLIGTDAPGLGRAHVTGAFAGLRDHRLVLGPAADGGYYLVGLSAPAPSLFEGIDWSTPSVLAATIERARAMGLVPSLLAELGDVDTVEDVRRERQRLAPLLEGREALRARIERL